MRTLAATLLSAVICASCTLSIQPLPAEEVLDASVRANKNIAYAQMQVNADIQTRDAGGNITSGASVELFGNMQDGGSKLSFTVHADSVPQAPTTWSAEANVITMGEQEAFINMSSFTMDGEQAPVAEQLMSYLGNTWWKLPQTASGSSTGISPDPTLLSMQADIIDVETDNGFDSLEGKPHYHYNVVISAEKLAEFMAASGLDATVPPTELAEISQNTSITGEVWIDAETFVLSQAYWDVQPKNSIGTSADIRVRVRPEDAQETISAPAALDLPIDLSQILSTTSL